MNTNKSKPFPTGCVTLVFLLTVIFVVLKYAGFFPWSWWWVFSPFIFFSIIITSLGILFAIFEKLEEALEN